MISVQRTGLFGVFFANTVKPSLSFSFAWKSYMEVFSLLLYDDARCLSATWRRHQWDLATEQNKDDNCCYTRDHYL